VVPVKTSTEEYVLEVTDARFGNLSGNKWFPLLMTSLILGNAFFNPR
jgi:hypothetical protein